MRIYHVIFILILITHFSYSQTHIYKHYGVDEGLPSSEVYDLYQDKKGYIWFATDKGLSRFNGYEFENFATEDGLPGNTILDFYPQKNGQVWCYGYHSQRVFYFNDPFDGFKTFRYNKQLKKHLESRSLIKSIVLDKNNTLNIGGYNIQGLIKIDIKGKLTNEYTLISKANEALDVNEVYLGVEQENGVFFSLQNDYKSTKELFVFKPKRNPGTVLSLMPLNKKDYLFIDRDLGIASKDGNIKYFDTERFPIGIKRISNETFFVGFYNNGAEIRSVNGTIIETFLPKKSVTNFLIDTEGSYWFTTLNDGVFYVKSPKIQVFSEDHISSLVKDNNNKLYAGFYNGNISQLSKNKPYLLFKGSNKSPALVELNTASNELYGYSDGYLKNYTKKKTIPLDGFTNNLPEEIGNPLLSSSYYTFNLIKNDSITNHILTYKTQDICAYNETILMGTSSGLHVYTNDSIRKHQPLEMLKSRIDDIDINSLTNTVYMATQGHGVVVYGDSIYSINKKNGLTNNIISEIHIENDSTVWACSNTGLNRITFKSNNSYNIKTITKEDGLISNDIDDVEIINDTVWVATKKGLCFFKKDVLFEKSASKILSLSLIDVTVNNTCIDNKNKQLNYQQNNIDFKLQAISHKNTTKINYLYRLKEIDTNWSSTTNRNIKFPSLSPGNYTFQAKASIMTNESSNIITYTFKILPPFWKSWWFYGICLCFASALVYLFFKIRVFTYNKNIIGELLRLAIRRLKRKEQYYNFRSNAEDFKIPTNEILFINSQGNYLDIITIKKTYTIRCKIGDFIDTTPDKLEYVRVHRSYIIRIDKVNSKGKNWVVINDQKIPVGETYLSELEKIQF